VVSAYLLNVPSNYEVWMTFDRIPNGIAESSASQIGLNAHRLNHLSAGGLESPIAAEARQILKNVNQMAVRPYDVFAF